MRKTKRWFILLIVCFALPQKVTYGTEELIDSFQSEEIFDGSSDKKEISKEVVVDDNFEIGSILSDVNEKPVEYAFSSDVIYCPKKFMVHSKTFLTGTWIEVHQDWSFTVDTVVRGGPDEGPGYNTTWYFAQLQGQFDEPIKLNEYSYSFPVLYTRATYEEGYQYIQNNIRYFAVETDDLLDNDELIMYLPGTPVSMLPAPDFYMVSSCIDQDRGVLGEGYYVFNDIYIGEISSEEDRLTLPSSSPILTPSVTPLPTQPPTPTPTSTPTPTPTPTQIPVSLSDEPPLVTGYYNSVKGADIRWTKTPGAQGYNIYRKRAADGTKKVGTVEDPEITQFYDGDIRDNCWGRVYVYYVVPFAGDETGEPSTQVTLQRLAPMKLTSAVNESFGSVDLEWACTVNENKALGYEIQYATSKEDLFGQKRSFKKVAVNGRNKLSKTITDLVAGETYYFRIRCYVNYIHSVTGKQKKTWSQYSDVFKVMIEQ